MAVFYFHLCLTGVRYNEIEELPSVSEHRPEYKSVAHKGGCQHLEQCVKQDFQLKEFLLVTKNLNLSIVNSAAEAEQRSLYF